MKTTIKKTSGKKTYAVCIGAIMTALQPAFAETGFDPSLIDVQMIFNALMGMTIRHGIAKNGKKPPSPMPENGD